MSGGSTPTLLRCGRGSAMHGAIRQGRERDGIPAAMLYQGKIVITGVQYGNAVVCVQPKRGCAGARCDGQVCKILHDPDVPPTHQYMATYRYLEQVFGADVLIHVGTHGNLEFLPGKGVGLSKNCYPDICIWHHTPSLHLQRRQPARGDGCQAPQLRRPGGPHANCHDGIRAL